MIVERSHYCECSQLQTDEHILRDWVLNLIEYICLGKKFPETWSPSPSWYQKGYWYYGQAVRPNITLFFAESLLDQSIIWGLAECWSLALIHWELWIADFPYYKVLLTENTAPFNIETQNTGWDNCLISLKVFQN